MNKDINFLFNITEAMFCRVSRLTHYLCITGVYIWTIEEYSKHNKDYSQESASEWFRKRFKTTIDKEFEETFYIYLKNYTQIFLCYQTMQTEMNKLDDKKKENFSDPTLYIISDQLEKLKEDTEKCQKKIAELYQSKND